MKTISYTIMLAMLIAGCTRGGNQGTGEVQKPNVVVIFIDDEGYGDVGCYGATGWETPYIDQMAANGMKFTNFYSPQPVCSASRAGLMTGCYPNRIGFSGALFPRHEIGINQEEYTMAEMFKDQGYATACFGKWHLGWQKEFLPLQHGFDEFTGIPYSNDMWPRDNVTGEKYPEGHRRADFPELPLIEGDEVASYITSMADQDKLTTHFTEKAVDFIHRNADQPFFVYVPHVMPHIPLGVSDKFRGKSDQGFYGDVMMEIDWSVGEIINALKENGIEENTIVVFTTDNGPWLNYGNHAGSSGGLREGKTTSWEGGQRVPFIIQWPAKVPPGMVCNKLGCAIDLLPTFAAITDADLPEKKIDGVNISALFMGDFSSNPRETILYYYGKNNLNGVRKGNWKLVMPHTWRSYDTEPGMNGVGGKRIPTTIKEPELYNMMRDPGEQYNVFKYHPEKVEELMKVVEQARAELGDLNIGIPTGTGNRAIGSLTNKLPR